ncbi:hypothetical protein VVR84_14450 [Kocuria carniphila]|uniref:Uncharacterized protein n=1 Tax=Kocuria carniphila TaxID=262208 RepID=A0ABV3V547_9MICC|nr:MAG: hypothetical protein DI613_16320 [Kocuria rhizophila]
MRWLILVLIVFVALVVTWQVDARGGDQFAVIAYPAIILFTAMSTLFLKYSGFLKKDDATNRRASRR